ncbi:5-formyltetrahydrofolate cyclo-ligase [Solitalea canadensis]|uniref:5-formyltetrahydrofolate cyclo-ligase n=1 Tax=Solitalea canadensis (strain ATCC 29591 / DSM 3403 / JCM 21819 / LMG 8368 / NBRC 15130 / NCIMB 12057 / USAM 9D) TaxID=929556 RepID=H8KMP3_SOLCM|nr:5-formyltetrahydrofolate cyclo-ligase [Solitalea canadensis]AFD09034.1 5,10-methenyltetrahydrofolate synthetase [Solitalea canadensis DSM 3403]
METRKAQLRKLFLEKRKALGESEFRLINTAILEQFKQIDLAGVNVLHLFLSIVEKHEIDTSLMVDYLHKKYPHIKIAVPQSNFSSLTLTHFLIDDDLVIEKNNWNIPEPVSGNKISPERIDMILVPLLAIDKKGFRVGYGKGFYDRFLIECRSDIKTIGLSQFEPIERINDTDEYDFPLNACITPSGIIYF